MMTDELRAILPGGEGTEAFSRQATLLVRHTRTRRRHAPAPETRAPIERFRCPADARARVRRPRRAPALRRERRQARVSQPRACVSPRQGRRRETIPRMCSARTSTSRADGGATRRRERARAESARRTVKSSGRSGGAWSAKSSKSTPGDEGPPSEMDSGAENVASSTAVMPGENLAELGDEALRAGDFARAVECYDAALAYARLDDYASVHRSRAIAHAGLGQWEHSCRRRRPSDRDPGALARTADHSRGGAGAASSDGPPRWSATRRRRRYSRGGGVRLIREVVKETTARTMFAVRLRLGRRGRERRWRRGRASRSSPRIKPPSPPSPSRRGGRSSRRTSSTGRRAVRTNTISSWRRAAQTAPCRCGGSQTAT